MTGIIGKKIGMSQIFKEDGTVVPVTLVEAGPGCVVQVKTNEIDGYEAVKVGFIEIKKQKHVNKAMKGLCDKAAVKPYKIYKEFKVDGMGVGDMVSVDGFAVGQMVKVSAVSKGKGFQGVMKRHNFSGGPASHGSMFYRAVGSIGASSYPSRVWKNLGMPGHMGAERVTRKNVEVVAIKPEQNLLILKGALPGFRGAIVEVVKQ